MIVLGVGLVSDNGIRFGWVYLTPMINLMQISSPDY
jgi:hypothetical protein